MTAFDNAARRAFALPVRVARKCFDRSYKIQSLCPQVLPNVTCIDVGASYYPHPPWEVFRRSPRTAWVAIDPNAANLEYIARWPWACSVMPVEEAVSGEGGEKILYVTNVDSGSSLLKPVIPESMRHRTDADYFYPLSPKTVTTSTMREIVERHHLKGPLLVKLDTQGTELSILEGLGEAIIQEQVVCVELESTLLASPLYEGAARFFDVQRFMERRGFELVILHAIAGSLPKAGRTVGGKYVMAECDAVFLLRPDILGQRSREQQLAVLGCYVAYELYGEALNLVNRLAGDFDEARSGKSSIQRLRRLLS